MTASLIHHTSQQQHPLVILGAGYTGLRVYKQAIETGWKVFATSRRPKIQLCDIPHEHRLQFDLTQAKTWATIPDPAHLLWCFPAVPLDLVKEFLSARTRQTGRLLVMGSTSAYIPDGHPITENTSLKSHLPRVQTEEYLRTTYSAVIIRLAGLYGPGRHVFDWIRKGKIQNTRNGSIFFTSKTPQPFAFGLLNRHPMEAPILPAMAIREPGKRFAPSPLQNGESPFHLAHPLKTRGNRCQFTSYEPSYITLSVFLIFTKPWIKLKPRLHYPKSGN